MVMRIDEEIRQRFGFGKYGLVDSSTPKEDIPYCQIATKRWLNDWISKLNAEVAKRVKELKPGTYVLSDDPQGQVFPYDYGRRWKHLDIVLHQTHDKPMPQDLGTAVITKFVKDTSGVDELWPFVHVEGTSGSYSLDEMREVMSRAFRNGATGISFFNTNWGGSLGRQENVYAPERWDYLNDLAAFYAQGHRAKLPQKAKVGVLYSGYTAMADYSRGIGAVYAYLGPGSGAYFKFIDNFSVERGETDPAAFDVIFAYHSELEAPAVVRRLVEAVRVKGVTLVITDTKAFSKDLTGRPLRGRDELLGGIEFGPLENRDRKVSRGPDASGALAAVQGMRVRLPHKIQAPAQAKCLLRYEDGDPACVAIQLGKGQVIWFGFNPFIGVSALTLDADAPTGFDYVDQFALDPLVVQTNPTTERFFRLLLSTFDIRLDERIWKLKLPAPRTRHYWPQDEVCLSGNSVLWSFSRPRTALNMPMLGRYRYSVNPAQKEEADKDGWISFVDGRLTDRIEAIREHKSSFDTVATWKDKQPFSVELDLGFAAEVNRVEIFATGEIPACSLHASRDGKQWTRCGRVEGLGSTEEVQKVAISARSDSVRLLRMDFEERPNGGELKLVEVDVWGNPLLQ